MTGTELVLAVLVLAALIGAVVWLGERRAALEMAALRQEMQANVAAQTQGVTVQLGQLTAQVTQQLGQVRQELQKGVADSGKLAMDAQREVSNRLQTSTEALRALSQQIGEVQKSSEDLSKASSTLQAILGGAKTRGILGEVTLERLLEDALPRAAYETQFQFGTGDIVDAIIRHDERILCIDSKFPLEAYRRFLESGEDLRKDFATAVKKHADSIAQKYILPDEHTLDYALMFVPSESVFYEMLMTEDGKGTRLDDYCRSRRVLAISPNTCLAYLGAVAMSLRGIKVEENARKLMGSLAGLEKQMELFVDVFEKLGTHLRNAGASYDAADSKLQRARGTLEQMADGTAPEALPAVAQKVLDLKRTE
jgi:DNA recombination protein RmuC